MSKPSFRRKAQRATLAALGHKARELVKSHTINETLALMPELSRATLYRAMNLSVEFSARYKSAVMEYDAEQQTVDPLAEYNERKFGVDPLLL